MTNFLNIITIIDKDNLKNLWKISESINIPKDNYKWIVICDSYDVVSYNKIPKNCVFYSRQFSLVDNLNFALDTINKKNKLIYILTQDNTLHPFLWKNIKKLSNDFISFPQLTHNKELRLSGEDIGPGKTDFGNFIVRRDLIDDIRFRTDSPFIDGTFALDCFQKSKNSLFIPNPLSIKD